MQTTHRTPATAAPVARQTRRDLDVVAILAVILVVIGHFWLGRVTGGVDVLLVLAGYYVGDRALRCTSVPAEIGWWARRVIPALVLTLTVSAGLTLAVQPQTRWESFAEQTLANLGFYQNWLLATTAGDYVQAGETVTPLQHLWALSVAAQVLLVVLLLAWLIRRRLALLVVLAAAAVASLVWAVIQNSSEQTVAYYSSFTRAWELLAGVLAAFAVGRGPWPGWLSRLAVVAGLIAIVASGFLADGLTDYPGPWALVPVLATVLVIVGGAESATARFAGWAFVLYLWHWPLLIFWMAHTNDDTAGAGESTAILGAAVVAAFLTWRCVDTRWWPSWHPLLTGGVTACLVAALAVAAVGWREHVERVRDSGSELAALSTRDYPGARAVIENRRTARLPVRPTGLEAPDDVPPATIDRCLADFGGEEVVTCVYGDPHAGRTIALAGGSHSEHWLTALHTLGREHGFRVTTYLKMGCPLTTAEVPIIAGPFTPYPSCRTWSDNAMAQIIADRPDYVFFTTTRPVLDGPGDYVPDHYLGIWDELSLNGIAMLGIRDTPWMLREGRFFSPVDCLAAGDDADSCGLAREEALQERNPTLDYAADYPMMQLLDLSDAVCRPNICRAVEGNVLIYHDAHHLSGTYVRSMAGELGRQLADATGWW
ncbi:acyltransferase [Mycolicibacterium sp. P9-22]|nr:acyltransferase [Mycolicibacterium sp. P9-22]